MPRISRIARDFLITHGVCRQSARRKSPRNRRSVFVQFVKFVASLSRCKFVHSFSEVGGHGPGRGLRGSSWINGFSSGFDPRISVHPRPNSTGATCSSVFGVQRARAEILSQLLSPGARCQPIWRSGNASTGVRALYSPRRPGVHEDARRTPDASVKSPCPPCLRGETGRLCGCRVTV